MNSRTITFDRVLAAAAEHKTLWQPTSIMKIHPKTHRKSIVMVCTCGHSKWVDWAMFKIGRTLGCRGCMIKIGWEKRRAHAKSPEQKLPEGMGAYQ